MQTVLSHRNILRGTDATHLRQCAWRSELLHGPSHAKPPHSYDSNVSRYPHVHMRTPILFKRTPFSIENWLSILRPRNRLKDQHENLVHLDPIRICYVQQLRCPLLRSSDHDAIIKQGTIRIASGRAPTQVHPTCWILEPFFSAQAPWARSLRPSG